MGHHQSKRRGVLQNRGRKIALRGGGTNGVAPCSSDARGLMEQLEPRIVLSTVYYEWVGVETLPGFAVEYGEPDAIAGMSENGRFMWSEAATDPADADTPYLVIDGEVRYLQEIESLSNLRVHAINSDGLVLATELTGEWERVLTTQIGDPTTRTYLDEYELVGDSGLDPTQAEPVALTDGDAVLVQTPVPDTGLMQLWIVDDREVSRLWEADPTLGDREYDWEHAGYGRLLVDTNAGDAVIGYRGGSESEIQPMLWSPQTGMMELADLTQVASINNDGTIFAKQDDRLVLWRDGDTEWTGTGDGTRDGEFGSASVPVGRAADGEQLWVNIRRGSWGSAITPYLSGGSPYRSVVVLERDEHDLGTSVALTESGVVHDGRAGWFAPIDPTDGATALAGARTYLWTRADTVTVAAQARRERGLTIALGRSEQLWSLSDEWTGTPDYFAGELIVNPWGGQDVVYRGPYGLQVSGEYRGVLGAEEVTSRVTGFFRPNGFIVVAGTTDAGELHIAFDYEFIFSSRYGSYYSQATVSLSEHLARRGLSTPAFASNLDSFATPWGAMNIVGLDDAGDLHAVWWSPGLGSPVWTTTNLSDITGAPKLVGNITASSTAWNGMQIMGTDERGHLVSIWWSPTSGGWKWADLTAEAGGGALEAGSIAGATTPWGAIEIIGRTAENELVTYWWAPGSDGWVFESITAQQVGDAPRITGPVSLVVANDGSQHIAG
ncbi:hypothetical protein MNBD_PLANCTO03-34, partial [hydrothermal vent metagenome]